MTRLKQEPWIELDVEESGIHHIRLRVKPTRPASSHWSEWSPTASWTSEGEVSPTFGTFDAMPCHKLKPYIYYMFSHAEDSLSHPEKLTVGA